jgi:hypothetical protein
VTLIWCLRRGRAQFLALGASPRHAESISRVERSWGWLGWPVFGGGCSAAAGTLCAGQTPVILRSGEVESEQGRTVEALAGFIGAGAGNGTSSAWRDAGRAGSGAGRALASSGCVEHVEVFFYPCSKAC